jgi:hypothetical protein
LEEPVVRSSTDEVPGHQIAFRQEDAGRKLEVGKSAPKWLVRWRTSSVEISSSAGPAPAPVITSARYCSTTCLEPMPAMLGRRAAHSMRRA